MTLDVARSGFNALNTGLCGVASCELLNEFRPLWLLSVPEAKVTREFVVGLLHREPARELAIRAPQRIREHVLFSLEAPTTVSRVLLLHCAVRTPLLRHASCRLMCPVFGISTGSERGSSLVTPGTPCGQSCAATLFAVRTST